MPLVFCRDGNAGRSGSARLDPVCIRPAKHGLARPVSHTPWPAGPQADPLLVFLFFMIKLVVFKNWKTLKSSQNYVKTLGN